MAICLAAFCLERLSSTKLKSSSGSTLVLPLVRSLLLFLVLVCSVGILSDLFTSAMISIQRILS